MRRLTVLFAAALLNFAAVLFIVAKKLPDRVPVHMNFAMEYDRFGSKWTNLLLAGFSVLLVLCMIFYRKWTLKSKKQAKNRKIEDILFTLLPLVFFTLSWLPNIMALNYQSGIEAGIMPVELFILLPMSILMIVLGNYMGIIKQNHWVGIRTGWTLKNEEVWKKTHRLGGYTTVAGGVVLFLSGLAGGVSRNRYISISGLVVSLVFIVLVPVVYSYICYKKTVK